MRETRLKKVEDLKTLQAVKTRYIKAPPQSYNNIYLLDHFLGEGNGLRGAYLEELEGGVVCLIDRGTHYQLLCSIPLDGAYRLPELDKEICCEFISYSDCKWEYTEHYSSFLRSQGFQPLCVFQEMKYCAGQLHPAAKAALPGEIARLKELGICLEPVRPESKAEIEALIASEIGTYDSVAYGDAEWKRETAQGNLLGAYCKEELAALLLFQPTGSRYVVRPEYRGKHLAYTIETVFFAENRWENSKQWQREWIALDNGASRQTVLKLGYSQTNRLRYRWLRYPKGEGLR